MGATTKWGRELLCNFEKLSTEEQRSFGWIKDHQTIVLELSEVFETTEKILKIIKNEGLSYKTIAMCLEISAQKQKEAPPTVVELLKNIDSHNGQAELR